MLPHDRHPESLMMSLGDHLEELRKRVLLALIAPLPLAIILFYFSEDLIDLLKLPLITALEEQGLPTTLQLLYPAERIVLQMKLAVIAALVLAFPWIIWQLWKFIQPGLYAHERRFVYFLLPGSFILSIVGTLLLYFVMLPLVLLVLVGMGESDNDTPPPDPRVAALLETEPFIEVRTRPPAELVEGQIWFEVPTMILRATVTGETNEDGKPGALEIIEVEPKHAPEYRQEFQVTPYINFVLLMLLGIVVAFQMPMVVVLLGWVGLASADWLSAHRKYALLICGFVSAVVTPPDVVSMMIMLVPLYGLYELGIVLLRLFPAHRVAEGPRWPWQKAHKSSAQTEQLRRPERAADSIARQQPPSESSAPSPDDERREQD